ncbi:hypothetical protein FF38_04496 [Lucilia cuprina]|uniref:Uncharacterized protein n=1 Tax=Lucilia cuprina TaxID=7375 RepID=A0A0L0BQN9_LUCCU|nr:hypothetical protein FF38_04496 [Lucilia cuprina]
MLKVLLATDISLLCPQGAFDKTIQVISVVWFAELKRSSDALIDKIARVLGQRARILDRKFHKSKFPSVCKIHNGAVHFDTSSGVYVLSFLGTEPLSQKLDIKVHQCWNNLKKGRPDCPPSVPMASVYPLTSHVSSSTRNSEQNTTTEVSSLASMANNASSLQHVIGKNIEVKEKDILGESSKQP